MKLFDDLVARAHWKAEEIRVGDGPIDEDLALARYDPNPFNWSGGMRQDANFLWVFPRHETIRKQTVQTRLKHLLATQNRLVNFPYVPRADSDENNWKRFKEIAENEMTLRREHCLYLGIRIEGDRYEGDPSKWHRGAGGTKATVYYEWTNVFVKSGVAYRTGIMVSHLLHHSRGPPKGPLSSTAPPGLVFTVDYAEALGRAVHEDIAFKGIAYESDAPYTRETASEWRR